MSSLGAIRLLLHNDLAELDRLAGWIGLELLAIRPNQFEKPELAELQQGGSTRACDDRGQSPDAVQPARNDLLLHLGVLQNIL